MGSTLEGWEAGDEPVGKELWAWDGVKVCGRGVRRVRVRVDGGGTGRVNL